MQTLKCFQLLIVLVFSMLVSCVEIIEFDTTREGGQLVVDGAIATGSGPFEVYLGRTASAERKTTPLEDASITLFDEQGNSIDYEALGEGRYRLRAGAVSTEIGKTYHIQINLPNGKVYESEPETIPPVGANLEAIYFDFSEEEELNRFGNVITFPVVNAYVDLRLEPTTVERSFFRFDVEEVFLLTPTDFPDPFNRIPPPCYVYAYPNTRNFLLTEARGSEVGLVEGLKVASQTLDWSFEERHYFNVYLQSLTERAYTFWDQIDQTVSNVGTIFDAPPAPILGNIYNLNDPDEQVLGYFSAVARDTIRGFLTPGDTPRRPLFDCQFYPFETDYPDRCVNCLSVPGSTLERPDYF